ncbi:hypothetical protein DOY81_012172 [Sarcophaga bullata]|nr:hypothetical protein DOY81_012172 [Sarcophaga bullata]
MPEAFYDDFDGDSRSSFSSIGDFEQFEDYYVQADFDPAYATWENKNPSTAVMALDDKDLVLTTPRQ